MTKKRWLFISIILLPLVCLIGVPLAMQIRIWLTPTPRWTIAASDQEYASCEHAAESQDFIIQPVDDHSEAKISRSKARQIADRVIAKHHGWGISVQGFGTGIQPDLVQMTLPNGQDRLAWHRVVVIDVSSRGPTSGTADIVYVDAKNGDPLVLVTDVAVGDPPMTCGMDNSMVVANILLEIIPALLAIYGAILGIVGGLILLWQRVIGRRDQQEA